MIGFIYIMSNPLHPDDLKIGQSSKDPNERRKELETTGKFSFIHFYERRARRILPALFVVILTSLPFA